MAARSLCLPPAAFWVGLDFHPGRGRSLAGGNHLGYSAGKMVVVVWNPEMYPILSPWVRYFSHVVLPTYDAALEFIKKNFRQVSATKQQQSAQNERWRDLGQ